MAKCVYRGTSLNSDVPPNDDTASVEHIIPWAIGGSNGLVTRDASRKGNNDLGSEVDAPFANTLPLAFMRHRLQLKSNGGNVPPITWRGQTDFGDEATFTINADGSSELDLGLKVERPPRGESGRMTIAGSHDRAVQTLEGMLKGMRKRGEIAYSETGQLLESVDDFLEVSEPRLVDNVQLKVEYFNKQDWGRGILKIVLALGHHMLGPEWSEGPGAEPIRAIVMNSKDNWPVRIPRGYIAGMWSPSFRRVLGKTKAIHDALIHTVAILPGTEDGRAIALVSLFGGNNVPEAVVDIGKLPQSFIDKLNADLNTGTIMGYQVDPVSRVTTPITLEEIDKRNRTLGPTNKRSLRLHHDQSLR